jgi:hypothetical protein
MCKEAEHSAVGLATKIFAGGSVTLWASGLAVTRLELAGVEGMLRHG